MSFTRWGIFHLLIMLSPAQKHSPTDDCKFLYIGWFMEIGAYVVKNALIAVFLVILVFLNISKLHDLLSLPHNNRK